MTRKPTYFILLTYVLLNGCQAKKGNQEINEPAMPVVTSRVTRSSFTREIPLSGNIEGDKTVRLGFLVAGKIDFIAANEGQPVSKGRAPVEPRSHKLWYSKRACGYPGKPGSGRIRPA